MSRELRRNGKYGEALPAAQRAVALREKVLGSADPAVADALHVVAVLYDDTHGAHLSKPGWAGNRVTAVVVVGLALK